MMKEDGDKIEIQLTKEKAHLFRHSLSLALIVLQEHQGGNALVRLELQELFAVLQEALQAGKYSDDTYSKVMQNDYNTNIIRTDVRFLKNIQEDHSKMLKEILDRLPEKGD
jgi:hypothetical protein